MRTITVLDILDAAASRLPDKIYLQDEAETVTYGRCREEAMRLGYALNRELGGALHRPVILFIDKSCRCVTAMLGVLYSGNFYVPMDVKTPAERLDSILDTMKDAVVVTTEKDRNALLKAGYEGDFLICEELLEKWFPKSGTVGGSHSGCGEDTSGYGEVCSTCTDSAADSRADGDSATDSRTGRDMGYGETDGWLRTLRRIRDGIIDTDLMYVLFTSGSTGIPKGVAVMHRSVIDYIEAFTQLVHVEETDIHGNQTPFYTDMSLKDIYMAMKAGATVCLIPQKLFMSPRKLLAYLDDHHVTTLMWVPTAYRLVSQFDALERIKPCCLKKFLFSGESMPVPVYRYWKEHYPEAEFTQQYGPTEITGACTNFCVRGDYGDNETIPIGKPFPNTGILLMDEDENVIDPSNTAAEGEICVYGTCLAAGYYNAPEKTREAFVPNPVSAGCATLMYRTGDLARYDADGNLVFASRKDYQVKHGGRRIELGEIETAFQTVDGVKAACCVQNRREDKLVLYYIGTIPEEEISLAVRERLPKYMIPAEYHRMESLPVLSNGKMDRKKMDQWTNR